MIRRWFRWRRLVITAGITLVLSPVAAALNPQAFGLAWARSFDITQTRKHQPTRIIEIACVHDGKTVYLCKVELRDDRNGVLGCAAVALGLAGTKPVVLDAKPLKAAVCGIPPKGSA